MTQDHAPKQRGVLIRAQNGDVIGYDDTGLRMVLSDTVVADLARRLPTADEWVDPAVLGDIDAWNARKSGDWYRFDARLPGQQGPRSFCRRITAPGDHSPEIIAAPTGALFALLSLGGARRGLASDAALRFPYHVVTTGDDLGPAGAMGTETNAPTDLMQTLREQTRDSLLADEVLSLRHAAHRALPVIYARGEGDSSAALADLRSGPAMANFRQAVDNLTAAAQSLNLPAKVLAVALDFTAEDVVSDAETWRREMYGLMTDITQIFAEAGLRKPLFQMMYDAGTADRPDAPVLRAQWDLVWNKGGHDILYSAPGYMFAQDRFGRPTPDARLQMAEMEAQALETALQDEDWTCPLFLLAEREADPATLRVRAQAMGGLVIDADDPLDAGPACGFRLEGAPDGCNITSVSIAPDDPQDLLIQCSAPVLGNVTLCYALGHPKRADGQPGNRGAIRDDWSHPSRTGVRLHRWALPAALPVH